MQDYKNKVKSLTEQMETIERQGCDKCLSLQEKLEIANKHAMEEVSTLQNNLLSIERETESLRQQLKVAVKKGSKSRVNQEEYRKISSALAAANVELMKMKTDAQNLSQSIDESMEMEAETKPTEVARSSPPPNAFSSVRKNLFQEQPNPANEFVRASAPQKPMEPLPVSDFR